MKKLYIVMMALLPFVACKKNETNTTPSTTTTPTVDSYYFHFTYNGADYKFDSQSPEYMTFNENYVFGIQEQVGATMDYPVVGFRLAWQPGHKVTESDLMNLAGKKMYHNDTGIKPSLLLAFSPTSSLYADTTLGGTDDFIQIDKITYLKDDVANNIRLKVYVVTGTCAAHMVDSNNNNSKKAFTNGVFHTRISRLDN
jgi:hypothetical protein